jgi:hypothetical protein
MAPNVSFLGEKHAEPQPTIRLKNGIPGGMMTARSVRNIDIV